MARDAQAYEIRALALRGPNTELSRSGLSRRQQTMAVSSGTTLSQRWLSRLGAVLVCSNDSGGSMKFLLTSAGINNASIQDALVDLLGKPIAESSALCIPTAATATPCRSWRGLAVHQRTAPTNPCPSWGGSPWACWSSPRCPASTRSAGSPGPGGRRPAGERRRRPVPVPLDAAVRAGGPPAVAARNGLGGIQRRQHGDDPEDR